MDAHLAKLLAAAACLRVLLAALGLGQFLLWRIEVSTPASSLLTIREGLFLRSTGLSPYVGSSCHVPPLLLALHSLTVMHELWFVLPNLLFDLLSGLLLVRLFHVVHPTKESRAGELLLQLLLLLMPAAPRHAVHIHNETNLGVLIITASPNHIKLL